MADKYLIKTNSYPDRAYKPPAGLYIPQMDMSRVPMDIYRIPIGAYSFKARIFLERIACI